MKRAAWAVFISIAGAAALYLSSPLWLEGVVSSLLSRQLSCRVLCRKAVFISLNRVAFSSLELRSKEGKLWAEGGRGSLCFRFSSLTIENGPVRISEELLSSLPPIGPLVESGPPSIDHLKVLFTRKKGLHHLRVLECRAKNFDVRGGLVLRKNFPEKAHLFFLLKAPTKDIPGDIRSRALPRSGGLGLRAVYIQGKIRLFGTGGPIIEARWLKRP